MVAITQFFVAGVMVVAVQALPSMPTFSTAVSATARFQKLLTQGGLGKTLLTGNQLKKQIVFPFTPKANATTAKGGVAVAAVSSPHMTSIRWYLTLVEHRLLPHP
jgi:hypothetical protein